jgi:hypothetical protein
LHVPGEFARQPGGIPLLRPQYLAARAHGRRTRDDAHARDDAGAQRTQRRDGRDCVARAGDRTGSGTRGPPENGSRLLQIEVAALKSVRAGALAPFAHPNVYEIDESRTLSRTLQFLAGSPVLLSSSRR